jgi:F0F1-type ATP synthase assembly protein I
MNRSKKNNKSVERDFYFFAFRILGDFGATIALPVIVFVLIGQWLDRIYSKGPLFTILAFVLAASITGKMIYKKAKNYGQEYQKLVDRDRKK